MTKIILFAAALVGVALTLLACKSKKNTTAATATNQPTAPGIVWGSGGGFTGKEVSFRLLESGQLYRMDGNSAAVSLKSIKPQVAKAMYSAAKELNLAGFTLDKPGNMYFFVEFQVEGKPHRITWGDTNAEVPKQLKDFHRVLNQLLGKGAGEEPKE